MAVEIGIDNITEDEYRQLQKYGEFDKKIFRWIKTPDDIKKMVELSFVIIVTIMYSYTIIVRNLITALKDFEVLLESQKKAGRYYLNNTKVKVAFICIHNSCRSQIAEALGKHLANDVFESYSAGTETKAEINEDAVRLMKELYNINLEITQYSKLLKDIPTVDIVVKMGCNVVCPYLPNKYEEDWGIDDPTGKSDEEFKNIIKNIEKRIIKLAEKVAGKIPERITFHK